tara:strand:- start:1415 stop:5038 length:3624 start_codon:yes stop_codon:yes gene_type:complete
MALKSNGVTQVPDGLGTAGKVLKVNSAGTAGEWGTINSNDLTEGSTNLFYTDARADARAQIKVDAIVGAAPGTLDTLQELGDALGDDPNFATTVTNSIATKLPLAGGTMSGDISFGDNNKAIFGAGSDLQIYHDPFTSMNWMSSNSRFYLNSTGNVWLGGPNVVLGNGGASEYYVEGIENGEVKLYYDNGIKLSTTSTGIDVTGTTTTDQYLYVNSPNGTQLQLRSEDAYTTLGAGNRNLNISANRTIFLDDAFTELMRIQDDGKVGIGTTNPVNAKVHIIGDGSYVGNYGYNTLTLEDTSGYPGLNLRTGNNNWLIRKDGGDNSLQFVNSTDASAPGTGTYTNRFTILSDGRVGIGTDNPDEILTLNSSSNTRLLLQESGNDKGHIGAGGGGLYIKNLAGDVIFRNSSDADTVRIKNDGNVGIGTTSPSEKLEVAGTTKAEQYLLDAIAKDISDTAVDVFIYDTRKDSDGGAWRKRTQHTSWYNETLNTSTRGSRKEFPAVAVIVSTTAGVTIYDADDPDMPMWMVFVKTTPIFGRSIAWGDIKCCSMLNGTLALGNSSSSAEGLLKVNFISDDGFLYAIQSYSEYGGPYTLGIASRASSYDYDTAGATVIVSSPVNDVAMTVLPNALIDSVTGLPVPTIAVATNGGTSLIKDNGSVVDILNWSNYRTMRVAFDRQGRLFIHDAHPAVGGYGGVVQFNTLPSSDVTTTSNNHADGDVLYYANYNGWNLPRSIDNNYLGFNAISAGDGELALGTYQAGFARLHYTEGGDGIAAFYGSDHASYYAPRNTKGVFLAETNTTSLTTSVELNDDVDMLDSSLWSYSADGVDWSVSGQVTITEQNGSDRSITRNIPTIIEGKYYRVEIEYTNATTSTSGNRIYFAGGAYYVLLATSVPTTKVFHAKARSGNNFGILLSSTNATTTILRMSVKEVDFDRHRSPLGTKGGPVGLIVNGTVTKTAVATGAELVGYSGFSSSNYLVQPYNSDLDFGTGDFNVTLWFNTPDKSVAGTLLHRGSNDINDTSWATNAVTQIEFNTSNLYALVGTNNFGTNSGPNVPLTAISNNKWHHYVMVRRSGRIYAYLDGNYIDDAANTLTNTNSTGKVYIGERPYSSRVFNGSLALYRISGTAPSPEQIKKIYNDEKFLFQENAKATLYGSSDAVTALAYDDDTELLHAGTSAGRSVFQGLRRIDNTTDAVGAAISASNGMVAED